MKKSRINNSSYGSHHLQKANKTNLNVAVGGKMTQFKNFDEIPDSFSEWSVNNTTQQEDISNDDHNINQWKIKSEQDDDDDNNIDDINSGMESIYINNLDKSSNPPLPYDKLKYNKSISYISSLNRNNVRQQQRIEYNNTDKKLPQPPSSKYFDYDENESSPHKSSYDIISSPVHSSNGKKINNGNKVNVNNVNNIIPPLPYEKQVSRNEDDSIYFSKKPRAVEFKPYTIKQYQLIKPKDYVEISNIKPDLNRDDLVAKRANLDRIKEFSKKLQYYNKETISNQPTKLPPSSEKHDISLSQQKYSSNRQKAIDFAKNIPKPKIRSNLLTTNKNNNNFDRNNQQDNYGYDFDQNNQDDYCNDVSFQCDKQETRIIELEAKHKISKLQIDAIRKSLGIKI